MYRADYHSHSHASPDGHDTVSALAAAAVAAGLDELCVTDHCECNGFQDAGRLPEDVKYYWESRYNEELAAAREEFAGKLRLPKGAEIAQGHEAPEVYRDYLTRDWDFVIGSLHNLRGELDFYYVRDFISKEHCEEMLARYIGELHETAALGGFDVLAHITYPLRYMRYKYGFDVSLKKYGAELEDIFRLLISNGCGIELNISGLRAGGQVTFPELDELKLYRACGGEIITVGSDAHRACDIACRLDDGYELLREAGFKYFTVFDRRVPSFKPLN